MLKPGAVERRRLQAAFAEVKERGSAAPDYSGLERSVFQKQFEHTDHRQDRGELVATREDRELLLTSGLFDAAFYLERYPDVAAAGVDPATHYLKWGAGEGRRPHPWVDGVWYLRHNPDVVKADLNPLVHFVKHGRAEGRSIHKRAVVYSAITGLYDDLRPPAVIDPDLEYVVFTDDQQLLVPDPWIACKLSERHGDNHYTSRFFKIHPHICLAAYEISAWVDAAFQLRNLTATSLDAALNSASIAFFPHPERDCAYDEADAVTAAKLDSPESVRRVVQRFRRHNFPRHAGLVESGIILRRHRDDSVIHAMEEWWDMLRNGSRRDQLSINFILWKQGLRHVILDGDSRRNEWAYWMGHRPRTLDDARRLLTEREREVLKLQASIEQMRAAATTPVLSNLPAQELPKTAIPLPPKTSSPSPGGLLRWLPKSVR